MHILNASPWGFVPPLHLHGNAETFKICVGKDSTRLEGAEKVVVEINIEGLNIQDERFPIDRIWDLGREDLEERPSIGSFDFERGNPWHLDACRDVTVCRSETESVLWSNPMGGSKVLTVGRTSVPIFISNRCVKILRRHFTIDVRH